MFAQGTGNLKTWQHPNYCIFPTFFAICR